MDQSPYGEGNSSYGGLKLCRILTGSSIEQYEQKYLASSSVLPCSGIEVCTLSLFQFATSPEGCFSQSIRCATACLFNCTSQFTMALFDITGFVCFWIFNSF